MRFSTQKLRELLKNPCITKKSNPTDQKIASDFTNF